MSLLQSYGRWLKRFALLFGFAYMVFYLILSALLMEFSNPFLDPFMRHGIEWVVGAAGVLALLFTWGRPDE